MFVLPLMLSSAVSMAAPRKVCWEMTFLDERDAFEAAADGFRRASNPGGQSEAIGHIVELWDKDSSGVDEHIGTYVMKAGRTCVEFEWEGEPYYNGESDPDVYLKYIYRVRDTDLKSSYLQGKDGGGGALSPISWRNGSPSDSDAYVAMNCQTGIECEVAPGVLIPVAANNDNAKRIMALDTAQRALEVYEELFTEHIDLRFPCTGWSCPDTASTTSQTLIKITDGESATRVGIVHEMGHILQMQLFDRNGLTNDCSYGDPDHGADTWEYDSCVTAEGWALFVAASSWFWPDDPVVVPFLEGFNFEEPQPLKHGTYYLPMFPGVPITYTCADNSHYEIQAARGFWDLVDAANEGGVSPATASDTYDTTIKFVARGWLEFANGTSNRKDHESDRDGVNLRDYHANNWPGRLGTGSFTTLLSHNCTGAQDDN